MALLLLVAGCSGSDAGGVGDRTAPGGVAEGTDPKTGPSLDSPDLVALRTRAHLASCDELTTAKPRPARRGGPAADSTREPLPEITLPCLGPGGDVSLDALKGRPTVINIWAQWCGPCREESPHFQTLYDLAGGRLTVMGIDYDDPQPARALAFVEELGLRYPQAADPDKRLRAPFGLLAGLPATVFVDADGRIVHVAHRAYESSRALARDVRTHLGVDLEMEP
jgi:cytochrome c biogenesis protein CcmG, thiol:disulfide interchange protein DsbE